MSPQAGILAEVPQHSRYLFCSLSQDIDADDLLLGLTELVDGERVVVGIGETLVQFFKGTVPGSLVAPVYAGSGIGVPSLPYALWFWLRGGDPGELANLALLIEQRLMQHIRLDDSVDGFFYDTGRDLTGYEDGTENPTGPAAVDAAIANVDGIAGSSFVAVQKWQHDLDRFRSWDRKKQDNTIGRRISDNSEIDDAPASAHVKRAAQESFDPEAFILRRSMPFADLTGEGLVFVAFGHNFVAFDMLITQMLGLNDGTTDALFDFSVPLGTSFFWCPAMQDGVLDLSLLGG